MHGESHYRPWEILRMTEAEIVAALDDDVTKRRPPTGSTPLSTHEDLVAHVEAIRRRTPEERLRRAMED